MLASARGGLFATARVGCEAKVWCSWNFFHFFFIFFSFFHGEGVKKETTINLRSGATHDLRVAPAGPFRPVTD